MAKSKETVEEEVKAAVVEEQPAQQQVVDAEAFDVDSFLNEYGDVEVAPDGALGMEENEIFPWVSVLQASSDGLAKKFKRNIGDIVVYNRSWEDENGEGGYRFFPELRIVFLDSVTMKNPANDWTLGGRRMKSKNNVVLCESANGFHPHTKYLGQPVLHVRLNEYFKIGQGLTADGKDTEWIRTGSICEACPFNTYHQVAEGKKIPPQCEKRWRYIVWLPDVDGGMLATITGNQKSIQISTKGTKPGEWGGIEGNTRSTNGITYWFWKQGGKTKFGSAKPYKNAPKGHPMDRDDTSGVKPDLSLNENGQMNRPFYAAIMRPYSNNFTNQDSGPNSKFGLEFPALANEPLTLTEFVEFWRAKAKFEADGTLDRFLQVEQIATLENARGENNGPYAQLAATTETTPFDVEDDTPVVVEEEFVDLDEMD